MRAKPMQRKLTAQASSTRAALSLEKLHGIYDSIAARYDVQHALITARADQRGRRLLVEAALKEGDTVLDPKKGALELYRVARPAGRIGVAHSTSPRNRLVKWFAPTASRTSPGVSPGFRWAADR